MSHNLLTLLRTVSALALQTHCMTLDKFFDIFGLCLIWQVGLHPLGLISRTERKESSGVKAKRLTVPLPMGAHSAAACATAFPLTSIKKKTSFHYLSISLLKNFIFTLVILLKKNFPIMMHKEKNICSQGSGDKSTSTTKIKFGRVNDTGEGTTWFWWRQKQQILFQGSKPQWSTELLSQSCSITHFHYILLSFRCNEQPRIFHLKV